MSEGQRDELEEQEEGLEAYMRLIERAAKLVAEAAAGERDSDPPLDPEPCP